MLHIGVDLDGVLAVHGGEEKFFDIRIAPRAVEVIQMYTKLGLRFSIISSRINCRAETHRWLKMNHAFELFESVLVAEDHDDSKLNAAQLLQIDIMIEDTPYEIEKLIAGEWEIWMPELPINQSYKPVSQQVVKIKGRRLTPQGWVADWEDIEARLKQKLKETTK
ncbi:HAD family hydrolase [Paenibacillus oceani]|uniref:Uncharacterized protein n=1 Tax=Paenibacillus oceani TaxID=2772510 RepID=A0A927C3P6_9BACL|nr:hypothetical protein [Paenibacillus oceani]MBD2860743.1 hypothetical protein [Paenibacillus oceani]